MPLLPHTRRDVLVGASALVAGLAHAARGRSQFTVGHLTHGGQWNPRPTAMRRLLWELGKRTSVDVAADAVTVSAGDKALFSLPFLYWAADGAFPPLSSAERAGLARYLTFGGFVLCDSVDGLAQGGAADSFRRELAAVAEDRPLTVLPRDHVVWKSFYLLERAEGRTVESPDLWGITQDNRLAAVLTVNDLGGALARDNFGLWVHEVVPGGDTQRERAFRLAVNVVMYALCLDYKADQVHIPFILKKRRR